jgi:DNA-binding CsgD family transcriptional regulator/MFS family permease
MEDTKRAQPTNKQERYQRPQGIFLASAGLGTFLFAIESDRLSALKQVDLGQEYFFFADLLALLVIAVLVVLCARIPARSLQLQTGIFRMGSWAEIGIGVLFSLALFTVFGQSAWGSGIWPLSFGRTLFVACEGVMFFFWLRVLVPFGARFVTIALALGIIVLATLNCLTIFLKVEAAQSIIAILPVVSAGCLNYFRRHYCRLEGLIEDSGLPVNASPEGVREAYPDTLHPDTSLFVPRDYTKKGAALFSVTLYLSIACLALIFGQIHRQWTLLQDGATTSLIIQLGTAFGSACGGLCMLALVRYFWPWARRSLEIYKILLLPVIVMALWLSSFTEGSWAFLYVALLNIVQKLMFLLILLAPFIIISKRNYLLPGCIAYLVFFCGRVSSGLLLANMDQSLSVIASIIALGIIMIGSIATSLVGSATDYPAPALVSDGDPPDTGEYGTEAAKTHMPGSNSNKLRRSCRMLAERFSLTKREEEILFLLARGRTAQYIATSLVITPGTVKTHLRSIYAKLDVHTQQEVLTLVEHTIDQQRNREQPPPPPLHPSVGREHTAYSA